MTTSPSLTAALRQDDAPDDAQDDGQDETPVQRGDMPRSLVWLFAATCTLSVANVYYAQPLLDALALDFNISHAAVGGVITATQVGCALALLLLVPLGDLVDRRRLMAVQLLALVAALAVVGCAQSTSMLLQACSASACWVPR
jgi:predicted MFS family arabinose efflux permease